MESNQNVSAFVFDSTDECFVPDAAVDKQQVAQSGCAVALDI
jgi:hypothetical protein